jgi:DUF3014 family protein
MNENIKYGAAAAAVLAASIGAVIWISQKKPVPKPVVPVTAPAPAPVTEAEGPPKFPVATPPAPEPLPKLDQSDEPALGAVAGLIGKDPAGKFLVPESLVRHFVVSIDNSTTPELPERVRPVKPVSGRFITSGPDDALTLSPANYARYTPLVEALRSVDDEQLLTTYRRYYPLFQEAYESLGHPPQYFNDRLIEVIDHLLATPEVQDPVALARPNVQFEFADPKLEALSSGQKALIRMGSANAAVVKDKLRSLRANLVEQKSAQ